MKKTVLTMALCACAATSVQAAEWSDTSIGYRTGTRFREPFNTDEIRKDIIDINHVSGYAFGTNFFNLDVLLSNKSDPSAPGASSGAQEFYLLYRNTVSLTKATGNPFAYGPVSDVGMTFGFDVNTKDDAGYNSKKRMLVVGPTLAFKVPGLLNVGVYGLWESNAPNNEFAQTSVSRYRYDTHPMLGAVWAFPVGGTGWSWEGFANWIASKGKDEFGNQTAPETNIDMQLLYDVGPLLGAKPKTFRAGFEYQYWHNKFGNDSKRVPGASASTPMVKAEYHF
jgi:nucleoside-specific outer membrane channel protein Tsx